MTLHVYIMISNVQIATYPTLYTDEHLPRSLSAGGVTSRLLSPSHLAIKKIHALVAYCMLVHHKQNVLPLLLNSQDVRSEDYS